MSSARTWGGAQGSGGGRGEPPAGCLQAGPGLQAVKGLSPSGQLRRPSRQASSSNYSLLLCSRPGRGECGTAPVYGQLGFQAPPLAGLLLCGEDRRMQTDARAGCELR